MSEGNGRRTEDFREREAADADTRASESDQTLSDTDQTLSDADQALAEQDQCASDHDQAASDRDQAASAREFASVIPSRKLTEAHAAAEAERARSTEARLEQAGARALSMLDRASSAARRDAAALLRDAQAKLRDRTAELRDKASDEHERALGRGETYPSRARAIAAADRARAAEDRARAAEDRARAAEDREQAFAELERAQVDDLTGFYRPGLGRAILQREIDRSRRADGKLVFAYCDVDGLKRVNDEHGHDAGDELLKAVAEAMRARLRSYDPVVRIGGDEFVCALPGVESRQAAAILHDVQEALTATRSGASISFGLSGLDSGDSVQSLITRGDAALRRARAERTRREPGLSGP